MFTPAWKHSPQSRNQPLLVQPEERARLRDSAATVDRGATLGVGDALRRLVRDYERLPQHTEAMFTVAAITPMSRPLP